MGVGWGGREELREGDGERNVRKRTDVQMDRQADSRQVDKQKTGRQTNRWTDRYIDKQGNVNVR